jgi:hypothetical protein
MGFLDWFRRPPPVVDRAGLTEFLDTRSAFLVQKSMFDYARGVSGPYFSQIIKERPFIDAVDVGRWSNYPLCLAMVSEVMYSVLRPAAVEPVALADALKSMALEIMGNYSVPRPLTAEKWQAARVTLTARIEKFTLAPPKRVMQIPDPYAEEFLEGMPFHERFRGKDLALVTNNLRANLIRMHDELSARAELPIVVADLGLSQPADAAPVPR